MPGLLRLSGRRPGTAIVLSILLVLAIVALSLARNSAATTATATGGGPEMVVNIPGGECDDPARPTTCTVGVGEQFTLSVEVVTAPAQGYILVQSLIDYGGNLLYTPTTAAVDEFVWPDCSASVALRLEFPGLVHHTCVTGLFSPPTSNHVGNVVDLSFDCSVNESSTEIKLRPYLDNVAGLLGALFKDVADAEIVPKVSNLTVTCSDASAPTATSTASPTPTASVTPTPSATTSAGSPTETAVGTATPTPTATRQATATVTATATPTPTPTSTLTPTPCPADSVLVGGSCVTVTPTYTPTPDTLVGDTSCDGVVNPLDAALILQFAAGMIPALPCPGGGDSNGDGVVNPLDAALVLRFSAGLIGNLSP